jgi:NitT/TauT family transport system substrate-binding protein
MRRRQLLAATAASALAPFAALGQVPGTIRAATSAVEEFALPYYADQKGFFREAGLNVDLRLIVGGGVVTQALVAGALDVAVTNSGSMSLAYVHGLPLYLLAPCSLYSRAQPSAHIVVLKNSPIREAKDLIGKTIGVTTLHDMIQAAVMAWIDGHGGSAKDAKFFEVTNPQMQAALENNRIDAAAVVEPVFSRLSNTVTSIGLPYESVNNGNPFQTTGVIGYKPWVDANRSLAARFAQVILHTAEWANNHPAEVTPLLAQLSKIDPAILEAIHRVQYATKTDSLLMQPVIDKLARYDFLPRAFPASDMTLRDV